MVRPIKSERLKKLESELKDLEQWLKLGLVPKKDILKHKEEIKSIQEKLEEERERLQFLKESGEAEEFAAPKRPTGRTAYTEMPTIPDIEIAETAIGIHDSHFDMDTEAADFDTTEYDDREEEEHTATGEEDEEETQEEESYFSDRNRWRRGGIVDPDADEW